MGACTVAIERPDLDNTIAKLPKGGPKYGYDDEGYFVWVKLTGHASYDTGGMSIPLTSLPIKNVTHAYVVAFTKADGSTPYGSGFPVGVVVPGTAPKLKCFNAYSGSATEASAASAAASGRIWYLKLYGEAR